MKRLTGMLANFNRIISDASGGKLPQSKTGESTSQERQVFEVDHIVWIEFGVLLRLDERI